MRWHLRAIVFLFLLTQGVFFLVNVVALGYIFPYGAKYVSRTEPEMYRELSILIPLFGEDRSVIEETLECVRRSEYPSGLTTVYVLYEPEDAVVGGYVDDLGRVRRVAGPADVETVEPAASDGERPATEERGG